MKYKTSGSIFPSPENEAEQVAEDVYYAAPDVSDGSVIAIPKTAPVIEAALQRKRRAAFGEAIAIARKQLERPQGLRHTDWIQEGQNQAREEGITDVIDALEAARDASPKEETE